jgi:hypothetical protein
MVARGMIVMVERGLWKVADIDDVVTNATTATQTEEDEFDRYIKEKMLNQSKGG